jgi:hypothetical protein
MIIDIIQTVGQFRDRFHAMGRTNQFTHQAFDALFEYYDEFHESIVLDVIGICCDWSEYTLAELEGDYDEAKEVMDIIRFDPETDEDDPSEIEIAIHEAMDDSHTVMAVGNGNWLVSP